MPSIIAGSESRSAAAVWRRTIASVAPLGQTIHRRDRGGAMVWLFARPPSLE
jgi:hypothetical protein